MTHIAKVLRAKREREQSAAPVSGNTDGLSQDYNGKLGRWFADRLGAREQLRRDMPPAAPAPAVPLTDEQIDEVASAMFYADEPAGSMVMAFRSQWLESIARPLARAIERAHGIGGGGNG